MQNLSIELSDDLVFENSVTDFKIAYILQKLRFVYTFEDYRWSPAEERHVT